MEGIRNIAEKIRADSQAQVNQIDLEAQNTINQIFVVIDDAIQKLKVENEKNCHQDVENMYRIMESNTVLEIRNERLHVKQEILDEIFEHALNKLIHLPVSEVIALDIKILKSIQYKGNETIVFCGKDKNLIATPVIEAINLHFKSQGNPMILVQADKAFNSMGGFVLLSDQFDLNYTFEAIIHRIRDEVEAEVVGLLFGSNG